MADRSLIGLMAAGLQVKAPVSPTTFRGPLSEISGVGIPHEPFAGAWQRNIQSPGSPALLSFSPIYACVTRIAGDIAKLALDLMVEEDGVLAKAPKASPFWRVLRKPNSYQTRIQFIRHWMLCKLIFGNAYAIKERDARGVVIRLYLIDPRKVTPVIAPDGGVYYSISGDDLARIPAGIAAAPASEVIHDRGPTLWHPLVGVPPLFAAALSGALGLAIQKNSSAFFANMSRPSGILTAPGAIDETNYERLKKDWSENYSGDKVGKLAILGDGLEYKALAMTAEQSELAKQLGMTAVDVATAYSMPAYKINQGQMPTNNNVGALNQQYYGDCLQVQIEDLEGLLSDGLEVPDGYSVQSDLDGLLRTDQASLYDALGKAVQAKLMAPNEGRSRIGLRPMKGGDSLWAQQQDHQLEALAERDAGPDPFGTAKPEPAPPSGPPQEPQDDEEVDDTAKALGTIAAAQAETEAKLLAKFDSLPVPLDAAAVQEAARAAVAQLVSDACESAAEKAATRVAAETAEQIKALPHIDVDEVMGVAREAAESAVAAMTKAPAEEQDIGAFVDTFKELLAET